MKLKQIGSNMTEVEFGATTILFSYSTPVAGFHPVHKPNEAGHFKTSQWYSQTTTRHINKYFRDVWGIDASEVRTMSQDRINEMVK